jgi:hypothetical protein
VFGSNPAGGRGMFWGNIMPGAIFQSGCPKGIIPGDVGCAIPEVEVKGIIGRVWKNPAVEVAELVPGVVTAGSC